ncbi:hypothetical protein WMY93_030539 [Mugilogobius chulae]|uniref:B30.2/SPRY domain-containing protein n=1 Tax=Mugilogobius chulae TaxID=88201 RepID=A0AAW0MEB8_9GOBI
MLRKQSLRNKLKALRSYRKSQRSLYSKCGERQALIKKQQSRCESWIAIVFQGLHEYLQREEERMLKLLEEDTNKLSWAASQRLDTLRSSVVSCDEGIESVIEQLVDGQQLNGSALRVLPPPEQLVRPDLLLNEAHYLGNLRYRVWNDFSATADFSPVILDPNTAAQSVTVSRDLREVSYSRFSPYKSLPQQLDWAPGVLASLAKSPHDTLQFTVEVGDHQRFEIGFICAKARRKCPRPDSAQLLLLSRRDNEFFWNDDKKSAFVNCQNVECITVLYDGTRKMLSFTDRETGFQLHVCSTRYITDHLYPFLAAYESRGSLTRRIRLVVD